MNSSNLNKIASSLINPRGEAYFCSCHLLYAVTRKRACKAGFLSVFENRDFSSQKDGGCTMKRIPWDLQEAMACRMEKYRVLTRLHISRQCCVIVPPDSITISMRNNENGISMQMAHLEYGLTEGKSGWKPTCRWQDKILDIYHNEPDTYKRLLHEARKTTRKLIASNKNPHADLLYNKKECEFLLCHNIN